MRNRGRFCLECLAAFSLVLLCTFAIVATEVQYLRATVLSADTSAPLAGGIAE